MNKQEKVTTWMKGLGFRLVELNGDEQYFVDKWPADDGLEIPIEQATFFYEVVEEAKIDARLSENRKAHIFSIPENEGLDWETGFKSAVRQENLTRRKRLGELLELKRHLKQEGKTE